MDDVPALDRAHLARQTLDDADLAREVLGLFRAQVARLVPTIAAPGPAASRADAAHTLKGSARGIGAQRVAALLEPIERDLRAGIEPSDALATLDGALEATQSEIDALLTIPTRA